MEKKYVWYKQSMASDFELIDYLVYDPIKNFSMDPSGFYVLIRINPNNSLIELAVCDKKHVIIKAFQGKKAQDLYYTIFIYEKKHKLEWFTRKDHVAYLGKELKKAEWALAGKEDYVQE